MPNNRNEQNIAEYFETVNILQFKSAGFKNLFVGIK